MENVEVTMSKYDKAEKIMDDYRTGLIFPFHINHELRQSEEIIVLINN